ncbi:MAG: hypothetical protein ACRBN8_44270 [Nannocystales bacterium]
MQERSRGRHRARPSGHLAEAACAGAFACGCRNAFTDDYDDEAACVEGIEAQLVDRALDDVGLSFNGDCTDRVATALAEYACETEDEAALSGPLFAASEQLRECRLFRGTASVGDACERLDGGLGDSCGLDSFCEAGVCVAAGAGGFEDACEADADCQQAFRCLASTEDPDDRLRCRAQPATSFSCSLSGDCGPGPYCSIAGSCTALPEAGQACTAIASQDGRTCAPGSACANGVCQAGAVAGDPCGVTCSAGLTCEGGFCVPGVAAVCAYELDAV